MAIDPGETNADEQKKVWWTGCFASVLAIGMALGAWAMVFFVKREQPGGSKPPVNPFGGKP